MRKLEKIKELIQELEQDIYDCKLDAGDGGDNSEMISYALGTLQKLKAETNAVIENES